MKKHFASQLALRFTLTLLTFLFFTEKSQALMTEIGLSYSYQKKQFNATNGYQTESKSASFSFYFLERLALELGYTDGFYQSDENDGTTQRVVQQTTRVADASLIIILLGKKSIIQPYIKGGAAYIEKEQTIKYVNASAISVPKSSGWGPSYGAGIKIALSERFSIRVGYDVWQTPLGDGTKSDDSALKAGLTWYL